LDFVIALPYIWIVRSLQTVMFYTGVVCFILAGVVRVLMEIAIRREFAQGPGTHSVDVLAMLYGYPMVLLLALGVLMLGSSGVVFLLRRLSRRSS
jgi:hypothetical protein